MKELEEYVYARYLKPKITVVDGKEIIEEKDIEEIDDLSPQERKFIDYIILQKNITVKPKMIEVTDRSRLVRDADFGRIESNNLEQFDVPKFSTLEYENETLVFEDYKQLEKFIEETIIPENVAMKKRKNDSKETNYFPSIQYKNIIKYRINEKELKYVMNYLSEMGIHVGGIDQNLDGEFENYDYFRTYKNAILPKPLDKEEMINKFMLLRATNDPIIREQLILSNMRLVAYKSWKYVKKYNFPQEDIEQYGYEGLIHAVDNFDPTLGYSFSTYADKYINGYIISGVDDEYDTPSKEWINIYKIAKSVVENEAQTTVKENKFLIEEIANLIIKMKNLNENKKYEIMRRIGIIEASSLDELDENSYDVVSMEFMSNPEKISNFRILQDTLNKVLDTLTEREEKVIRARFGLDNGKPKTLEEVGEMFNVGRERIRQIEAKALRKLRHPSRSKKLKEYLDEEYPDQINEDFVEESHKTTRK